MVNIFGNEAVRGKKGDHGPSGPRVQLGQEGDSGSIEDSRMWMPNTVLKNLELNDDKGCFFIDNSSTDVKRDKRTIVTWISSTKHKENLIAELPSKLLSKKLMNDRYALMFDGTARYYSTELGLFQITSGNCFGFLCMTFKTTSDDKDQVRLSTFRWREIHIQKYQSRVLRKRLL